MQGRLRALIVDDDRDTVFVLGRLMGILGCDVTTCQSSSECIGQEYRIHPQLIPLDIAMPQKNGFTVAEQLLNADLLPFYLAALSGYGGSKIEDACKAGGFRQHVLKPASTEGLRLLIESAKHFLDVSQSYSAPEVR